MRRVRDCLAWALGPAMAAWLGMLVLALLTAAYG